MVEWPHAANLVWLTSAWGKYSPKRIYFHASVSVLRLIYEDQGEWGAIIASLVGNGCADIKYMIQAHWI